MLVGCCVLFVVEKNNLKIFMYRVKLHSKLQFCHQGTKTQRNDMYFNLGALESLWLNE